MKKQSISLQELKAKNLIISKELQIEVKGGFIGIIDDIAG